MADSDADLLHDTISEFLWVANYVVGHAWDGEYKTTSKADLQRETPTPCGPRRGFERISSRTPATRLPTPYKASSLGGRKVTTRANRTWQPPTLVYDKRCATLKDHSSGPTAREKTP